MQQGESRTVFLVLVICAALFIWITRMRLPEVAASHFGGSGTANGFMSRDSYRWFMLLFVIALPLVLVYVPSINLNNPKAGIRLPNKEYWLAPDRLAETAEYLRQHMARFGSMLVVFLCYIHWLVIRANAVVPPKLSAPWAIGGIVVFVICALMWSSALLRRFRNVPR
jgi:uncharacterized membrane protein